MTTLYNLPIEILKLIIVNQFQHVDLILNKQYIFFFL